MVWKERLRDAAILGIPITIGFSILYYFMGIEINAAFVIGSYIKIVIGGVILFWFLKK